MKAGWKTVKLGEACKIVNGATPSTSVEANWGGPHCWITPAEMGGLSDPYVGETRRTLTDVGLADCSTSLLPKGSVILSSRAPIGHVIINTVPMATNQGCKSMIPRSDLDAKFLFYFIKANVPLLESLGTGATFKELSGGKLASVEIPLPPLAEQKRIVALLDEAFAGIDEAKAKAESNLQCAENLFKTHLTTVFTKRTHGWNEKSIYEVCERLHQGLNTAGEKVQFSDSGYPIIQTRNIEGGKIDIDNKMKYMSEADWQLYKEKYRPEIGDVFFTNIGTIGKTAIVTVERDYLIHWNIFKLRPLPGEITPEFLRYSLEQLTLSGYFEKMQKGGTVSFVTKKMISEAQIMAPNIVEQKAVTNILDELRIETKALASLYNHKLIELAKLKNSLLSQAFAGELTA